MDTQAFPIWTAVRLHPQILCKKTLRFCRDISLDRDDMLSWKRHKGWLWMTQDSQLTNDTNFWWWQRGHALDHLTSVMEGGHCDFQGLLNLVWQWVNDSNNLCEWFIKLPFLPIFLFLSRTFKCLIPFRIITLWLISFHLFLFRLIPCCLISFSLILYCLTLYYLIQFCHFAWNRFTLSRFI